MVENYKLVFDKVILNQLKKAGKNNQIREILSNLLDKIEELGPRAGELLDSKLFLYEVKVMHPPIRLYYRHNIIDNECNVFEFEMKTSEQKQQKTINKIRKKILKS